MANYNVDIAVALKGAKELLKLRKDINAVTQEVSGFNKALETNANKFPKTINNLTESVNKARTALKNATVGTTSFNNAAEVFLRTQKALNKELAEEARILKQIETRRFGVAQSSSSNRVRRNVAESRRSRISSKFKTLDTPTPSIDLRNRVRENIRQSRISRFGSGFRKFSQNLDPITSSLVPGQSLFGQSLGGASDRSRQILAENQALQEALGSMNSRAFGRFKFMPPIQGTTESQLALKTRVSSNVAESQRIREIVAAGSSRGGLGGGFKEFNKNAKKIQADTKKIRTIVAQNQAQGIQAFGNQQFAQPIGPVRPGPLGRLGIGTGANPKGIFASSGGRSARAKGALQSGLIGGGFPLLFGQGGAGAIAGGLGGLAGGALSPGFGFAGSIVATAAAQEIQKVLDFKKQVSELNMEMRSMGISSNISANSITKLGKSLGVTKEEAVKVLEQFKRFGEESIGLAKFFGGDFALFESFSQADNVSSVLNAIKQSSKELTQDQELRLTRLLAQQGAEAAINELIDIRRKKIIDLKIEQNKKRSPEGSLVSGLGVRQVVDQSELNNLIIKTDETIENLNKIKDNVTQQKLAVEEVGFSIVSEIEKIDKELRKLNNTQFQTIELSNAISSSFEDSFKGIIRGTMTVQDAFRDILNRIADFFIESAARMAATQLQRGILGLFGNALGKGSNFLTPGLGTTFSSGISAPFVEPISGLKFADGGRPPVGRASIVGERGPELFVPDRAGTIIPNNAMGSTNIVVNVDASGSSVEGDEQQGRELGRLISAAVQSEILQQKRPGGLLA